MVKADVYLSKPRSKIFLLKPGTDIKALPDKAQDFLADLEFHDQWEIDPEQPRIGLNTKEAISALESKGYYAASADITIDIV